MRNRTYIIIGFVIVGMCAAAKYDGVMVIGILSVAGLAFIITLVASRIFDKQITPIPDNLDVYYKIVKYRYTDEQVMQDEIGREIMAGWFVDATPPKASNMYGVIEREVHYKKIIY